MERTFKNSDIPKRSFEYFSKMKNKKELCDITFQVGTESISAHSIIITAVIPYFRDMVVNKDTKADKGGIRTPDIEPEAFKCLIDYAYNFQLKIDATNVRNLLAAACFLGVDEVKEACCDFLADSLELDNVSNILELASNCNCPELLISIDSYVKENFELISQTKDFLSYPSTYIKELTANDDLNIGDEKVVFEAVLNWVKNSPEDRKDELPDLIRNIRMTIIEPIYLSKIAVTEELIRTSILCRDLLDEARIYNSYPGLRRQSFTTEPRQYIKTACVSEEKEGSRCFYKLSCVSRYTVQHLNLANNKWHTKGYKTVYLNSGSIAEVQNKMYFIHWDNIEQYDPENNLYNRLADVPTATRFRATASLNNKLYVFGGLVGNTASSSANCFNPEENVWASVRTMPTCRWGASAVAFREYIYVLGGRDKSCVMDTVERYDPKTDRWKTMLPLLTKRSFAGASVLNGKIYVCGGTTHLDAVKGLTTTAEMYDPVKNRWEFISSMNEFRFEFTQLTYCGKLYVFGGVKKWFYIHKKNFEVYDPKSDKWTCIQPEGDELFTSGAVVLPDLNV